MARYVCLKKGYCYSHRVFHLVECYRDDVVHHDWLAHFKEANHHAPPQPSGFSIFPEEIIDLVEDNNMLSYTFRSIRIEIL